MSKIRQSKSIFKLYGRKVKRGNLGNVVADDGDNKVTTTSNRTAPKQRSKRMQSASKKKKKKDDNSASVAKTTTTTISPDLAQWVATTDVTNTGDAQSSSIPESYKNNNNDDDNDKRTNSSRGGRKQIVRKEFQEGQNSRIDLLLDQLEVVLEKKSGNVRDILDVVEDLLRTAQTLSSSSSINNDLRTLFLSPSSSSSRRKNKEEQKRRDYRLAWVGSDDAICHIGTGLHKVPLARMQEVFMNCLGRNRIEILEVISLLGPFPNVKNILQGTTEIISSGPSGFMQITLDSMVDGTGKEILAGTDDDIRRVNLQVAFADERVIVAVVPSPANNINPLDDDGKRVLLFVKENELDEKLNKLRVS